MNRLDITFYYILLQCATANPDGRKRALLIGGNIANITDVGSTFDSIITALKEKVEQVLRLEIPCNICNLILLTFVSMV